MQAWKNLVAFIQSWECALDSARIDRIGLGSIDSLEPDEAQHLQRQYIQGLETSPVRRERVAKIVQGKEALMAPYAENLKKKVRERCRQDP